MTTYEDALKSVICYCVEECGKADICPMNSSLDCCEGAVIESLKKQIKYRWHDLRKNPEDLPTSNMNVYIAYMWQESKKISYYLESFVEGEFLSPSDAEVIAWKYIEPVEEEEK